ncbi:DUF6789 family protein [Halococcus qingdaonensis]|uniref:DUF6789 family protein n=1 Tax=Halococcus qingdaonensis TaxID=224402 RepID=UPI0021166130|nr:DUF6789 family protein [Halococcus qingdaonensis]
MDGETMDEAARPARMTGLFPPLDRGPVMHRALRAITGGLVGTVVLGGFLLVLDTQARGTLSVAAVVGRFLGIDGRPLIAIALFAVVTVVVWPALFVAVEEYLPFGPDPAARAVAFAAVIGIVFVVVGRGSITGPILVIYVGFSVLAHLAYGFAFGSIYGRLAG